MKNLLNAILVSLLFISCQSNFIEYTISEKIDVSWGSTPGMKYKIILNTDTLPTDEEMKNTAIYIWKNGNKNWKEFYVLMYLPEMNTHWAPYGSVEFNQTGLIKFRKREAMLTGTKWEIDPTKSKKYTIELKTIKKAERNVEINIDTDFPDGTNFLVSIGRIYYMEGIDEAYSGDIFSKYLTVENGKIKTTVIISDTKWYNEAQKLSNMLPDDDWTPISEISDTINTDILFSPRRTKSADILEILGADGEYIKGDGVDKSIGFTTFSVSKKLNIPFKK